MKLVRIELYHVRMNLKDAFETSFGRKSELNHLIVKLYDESGAIGWGETASPSKPDYCPETLETCLHMQRDFLIPAILGKSFDTVEEFTSFYEWVRGNNFAKAGLEMAVWDLLAKSRGVSLSKMLGGTRPYIESGVSLGIEPDTNTLLSKIEKYLAEGYKRIKLKIKPGRDIETLAEVRRRYPDVPLTADANSAYTLKDIPHLQQFDRFNLAMIEQPLAHDDIVDHSHLQKILETPVCLDESIHSAEDARHALELGSCRVINVKPGRVGGLLEARKIHDVCQQHGVSVWCGGMHEYGIGRAHNVALCSLPNFSMPGDVSGSDKYFEEDLTQPRILASNGRITVPTDNIGIGYEVNEDTLKRHLIVSYSFI
ncbi:o-succinylbenzoate synthase [Candidatus Chlorohelix sp.]|uniref:o-succinylbenzoate synthase n=1 Tax=Candidatus Chlorohelix sp. TaxID=3139201 RepID=UPI0030679A62